MTKHTTRWLNACSLWHPDYIVQSAWIEHAPFAFWLIDALRPSLLVELGTHFGYSYFCFCQAVNALGCDTRCYAVDTWKGDEHAGFYGEDVFNGVSQYNSNYAGFSSLVKSTFAAATAHFSDGSIDLLHIDGLHHYDSVKDHFDTWKPKLSEKSVVIFHDCNVRERGFGVFRMWEELRDQYPSFEFIHGHGLGVLGTGSSMPIPIRDLFELSKDPAAAHEVRRAYSRLGRTITINVEHQRTKKELKDVGERLHEVSSQALRLEDAQVALSNSLDAERINTSELSSRLRGGEVQIEQQRMTIDQLMAERNQLVSDRNAMRQIFLRQSAIIGSLHQEMHELRVHTNVLQEQDQTLIQQNKALATRHAQMMRLARYCPVPLRNFLMRLLFRGAEGN